ncbi:MAG: hypothetical protein DHS20C18_27210 [Saprospiraceae bacterium]|nr:MAG: hypothetical protein DHS20C18_27210 [Saprospiraceae bacterium]
MVNSMAMLGTYVVDSLNVFFKPRFPLQHGRTYQVELDLTNAYVKLYGKDLPDSWPAQLVKKINLPAAETITPPEVLMVYPSSDSIPANQLKFYLVFSRPMRQVDIYNHIRILDQKGKAIAAPFLELEEGLWDPSGQRLTIWFDPGRIKTGLQPNLKMGPPLTSGLQYTLVVDKDWEDMNGQPMANNFEKTWTITEADRQQPNPTDWKITPPLAASDSPLKIEFPESLDFAMLHSSLAVRRDSGPFLNGTTSFGPRECSWQFTPHENWLPGTYFLRISTDLEDLAGNNLNRLFDTNLEIQKKATLPQTFIEIPLLIK